MNPYSNNVSQQPVPESPWDILRQKRNVLFSRIALFTSLIALVSAIIAFVQNLYTASYVDFTMAVVMLATYLLNQKRRHRLAKSIFLIVFNFSLLFSSYSYPLDTGLFFLFVAIICITSLLLGSDDLLLTNIFISISVICMVLTFSVPIKFIKITPLTPEEIRFALIGNLTIALILVIFSLYWMTRLTAQTENLLSNMIENSVRKNKELEVANEELDRFLYRTTHDLRSPLASVRGLIMMTREEITDPQAQRFLENIDKSIERLDSFTKEIIEYSKNALTEVIIESVNLKQLADDIVDSVKYMPEAKPIRFEVVDKVRQNLLLDKRRIRIVLHNLITNAIKYHDQSKPVLFIKITISQTPDAIAIQVEDNGSGIASEYLPKIFDMFYRATTSSTGSGLGLYIVKEALEKMNGEIKVDTALNMGSTFTITVPTKISTQKNGTPDSIRNPVLQ